MSFTSLCISKGVGKRERGSWKWKRKKKERENDVLHVSSTRVNLISIALLGKVRVKISFESDKIVITKNNVFMGKVYCDQGLFVLYVSEVINEKTSSSTYLIDSYYIWHARLGHVNPTLTCTFCVSLCTKINIIQ